ncbi:MAG: HlyD family efflux transporter periplasmic adaptor subunit [Woeseiaceae bacterium]|nr:HlyD family efflux transporter periplasmic adaptor subunit [Woeseiaceae bacterium]
MSKPATLFHLAVVCVLAACSDADPANLVVGELASDRIELAAEVAEPIVEIAVPEGTEVSAGDVLVRQDPSRATARLAEAEAALAQAQARLDELVRGPRSEQIAAARANVEAATEELAFRSAENERIARIHAQGLASPELRDRAKNNFEAAQANLKLRRAQLDELLTGTTLEELAQAEAAVEQAAARRDAARIDLERHTLVAPVGGVTDSRLYDVGERPSPGQPVMVMLAGSQAYARVFVPEALRVHVAPGTRATIRIDGLDGALDGRVRWVSSEAAFTPYFALTEHDRGRLSYVAKIDVLNARERLPDGLPVAVELHVD